MKIALITGSCGLVGYESVNFFIKKKFHIIGIDNNLREFFFGKDGSTLWLKQNLTKKHKKKYQHLNIDIRDYKKLNNLFKKYKKKIKIIIHAAAQPSHDWAASNPEVDFGVNANGTHNLLRLTKKYLHKKTPFIYMSTNKVYGDTPNYLEIKEYSTRYDLKHNNKFYKGIDESMSIDNCIHSLFGVSKLSADILVQEYGKNFGLNTVCFRAGCITGSNHSGAKLHGFLSYLVKSCIDKKNYSILAIFPYFVIGFVAMIILRNIGDQFFLNSYNNLWLETVDIIKSSSKVFLTMAMAAIGLSTNLRDLKSMGYKPFLVGFIGMATVGLVSILSIEFYINFLN